MATTDNSLGILIPINEIVSEGSVYSDMIMRKEGEKLRLSVTYFRWLCNADDLYLIDIGLDRTTNFRLTDKALDLLDDGYCLGFGYSDGGSEMVLCSKECD
jgi:hypothetical protein